jgi:SAM-dependent methyltransferase
VTVDRTEAGTPWSELARLDPLAAVLDPGDTLGAKNRTLDRIHKRALGSALGNLAGSHAIDFGSGTGRLAEWLVGKGAAVVEGVDVTPEMVEVAIRRRLPRARFTVLTDNTLPFRSDTFDIAVSAYVLQYYLDQPTVAAELDRVLRPGGVLAAIEQVSDTDIGRGGSVAEYRKMFFAAGFSTVEEEVIRLSDSRLVGLVQSHPAISHLPLLPQLVRYEARRLRSASLTSGRYADVLFLCHA